MQTLHNHGVYEVVQPEFEAGLEFIRQALLHGNLPMTDIQRFTDTIRRELYAPLYDAHDEYQTIAQLQNISQLLELSWVRLSTSSLLIGRTIQELKIRSETGVSIVGVMHNGKLHPNPNADYQFSVGDLVAVMGILNNWLLSRPWLLLLKSKRLKQKIRGNLWLHLFFSSTYQDIYCADQIHV